MKTFPFHHGFGDSILQLHHEDPSNSFRPWDGADEYILQTLKEEQATLQGPILILNDRYGALSVALASMDTYQWNDSFQDRYAIEENLKLNHIPTGWKDWTGQKISQLIVKIPKTLSLLEYQLKKVRESLREDCLILAGGMTKNIHNSTIKIFEDTIGPSQTSLARKKARLIHTRFETTLKLKSDKEYPQYFIPGYSKALLNLPHVFSQRQLDRGTALLIESLNVPTGPIRCADFGCGNGVLSLILLEKNPKAQVIAVDDSFQAVKNTQVNAKNWGFETSLEAIHGSSLPPGNYNLILSNPPFHQGQRVQINPALEFLNNAHKALLPGGQLWLVGNRHLGYHKHLKALFSKVEILKDQEGYQVFYGEK